MYLIALFLCAFLILSLLATNWPVKLYHHAILKKIGMKVGAPAVHGSLLLAGVYSEIHTQWRGCDLRIRFVEGSMDALQSDFGLELRLSFDQAVTIEFYRVRLKKREWGDFKRFLTGDGALDAEWFILTNDFQQAIGFYQSYPLQPLLGNRYLEQLLFHPRELIIRFQNGDPFRAVTEVLGLIAEIIG